MQVAIVPPSRGMASRSMKAAAADQAWGEQATGYWVGPSPGRRANPADRLRSKAAP